MMNKTLKLYTKLLSALVVITLAVIAITVGVFATSSSDDDPVIIVSLGDSYSSGEGIEPFYGQGQTDLLKFYDYNWVAHRSKLSWGGLLKFPNTDISTRTCYVDVQKYYADSQYDDSTADSSSPYQWYFVAASGAHIEHVNRKSQKITVLKNISVFETVEYDAYLPIQLDVFNYISGSVDYVTITIGGNDLGFSDVIMSAAKSFKYLNPNGLSNRLQESIDMLDQVVEELTDLYYEIAQVAGDQACILVGGYPELIDEGGGFLFSASEAEEINDAVGLFNYVLEVTIGDCSDDGLNIYFVDVEEAFSEHKAYSDDPWINPVYLGSEEEDVQDYLTASKYSIHPNVAGAMAYARCMNNKIAEIESAKVSSNGTLSGMVCKASDRVTPISGAVISVYSDNTCYGCSTGSSGNYSLSVPEGDYRVEISADGYISFTAYVTVTADTVTYTETYLMVQGEEGTTGVATGTITSALTGTGIEGVTLAVREGWDNTSVGDVITTVTTGSSGNYSVTLPIGNYTLYATKDGYVATSVNIVVQEGTTSSQNGSMSPISSGDSFRIVLTWGENPADLDSHVVGTLSSGSSFHTYFADKSAYDGSVEVCNLDVDDITSYGPETITLNLTTSDPYYYYIYHFSGSGSLATSEAQINVYQGETLIATFNVPTDQGSGKYWNVFAIVDGQLVVKNTITSSANTSYASFGGGIVLASLDDEYLYDGDDSDVVKEKVTDDESVSETVIEYVE